MTGVREMEAQLLQTRHLADLAHQLSYGIRREVREEEDLQDAHVCVRQATQEAQRLLRVQSDGGEERSLRVHVATEARGDADVRHLRQLDHAVKGPREQVKGSQGFRVEEDRPSEWQVAADCARDLSHSGQPALKEGGEGGEGRLVVRMQEDSIRGGTESLVLSVAERVHVDRGARGEESADRVMPCR